MSYSSIRNIPAVSPVKMVHPDDVLYASLNATLAKKSFKEQDSAQILGRIDTRLAQLSDDKIKISFLENVYSACDIAQPFGKQPDHIKHILQNIADRLKVIHPAYFVQISHIFSNIKHLEQANSTIYANNNLKIEKNIVSFPNGSHYAIQATSARAANCLMDAYSQGRVTGMCRSSVLSKERIGVQLNKMYTEFESDGIIQGEGFINFKRGIASIYDEAKNTIVAATTMDDLSDVLACHIQSSGCYLDTEIVAPILSDYIKQAVVIMSPNKTNPSGFLFRYIDHRGNILHHGEFSPSELTKLESSGHSPLFIINRYGNHFEWLKKLSH